VSARTDHLPFHLLAQRYGSTSDAGDGLEVLHVDVGVVCAPREGARDIAPRVAIFRRTARVTRASRMPGFKVRSGGVVLRPWCARGRITWNRAHITGLPPYRIAQFGIGYVPEERRIFPNLTQDGAARGGRRATDGGVSGARPRAVSAAPRVAVQSGQDSERGRAAEGLMPAFVNTISRTIREIQRHGVPVLLDERNRRDCDASRRHATPSRPPSASTSSKRA